MVRVSSIASRIVEFSKRMTSSAKSYMTPVWLKLGQSHNLHICTVSRCVLSKHHFLSSVFDAVLLKFLKIRSEVCRNFLILKLHCEEEGAHVLRVDNFNTDHSSIHYDETEVQSYLLQCDKGILNNSLENSGYLRVKQSLFVCLLTKCSCRVSRCAERASCFPYPRPSMLLGSAPYRVYHVAKKCYSRMKGKKIRTLPRHS
jgi:hypothetical protein